MDFTKAFKNKKVFLTGHTGFKGAWMSVWLDLLGAKVKGYALRPEQPSLYKMIASSLNNHESVIADVRNRKRLEQELLSFRPDYIFHMAAQPLVRQSYDIPIETFDINIMGTAHLLDSVRRLKNRCHVVVVTTDKVYRNNESGKPFKEEDPLGGHDPYSSSKAAAEIVAGSFERSYFHPDDYARHKKTISTARAGNVIGGGDYAKDRILPDLYRAFKNSQPLEVRNPSAVRPWQHVLEPLSGYLTLAAAKAKDNEGLSASFNFGPAKKDALSVEALVKIAVKHWGSGSYRVAKAGKSLHEAGLLRLDISRAEKELGWKPRWNAQKAVRHTVEWYRRASSGPADIRALCVADINEYIKGNFR